MNWFHWKTSDRTGLNRRRPQVASVAAEVLEERVLLAVGTAESVVQAADPPPVVDRYDFPLPGRDASCTATDADCYGDSSTVVTQEFGENGHAGDDIAGGLAAAGRPVTAIATGRIIDRRLDDGSGRGWGNGWLVWHVEEQPDGTTVSRYSLYAHLANDLPAGLDVGSTVGRGQVLGYVGSTGFSTGPHLHFEIKDVPEFGTGYYADGIPVTYHDPSAYIAARREDSAEVPQSVLNTIIRGEISMPYEADRYAFEARAGQEVTISATWGHCHGRDDLRHGQIRLIGPDAIELVRPERETESCNSLRSRIDEFELPVNGTYIVEVSGEQRYTGKYVLSISDPEDAYETLVMNSTTRSLVNVRGDTHEWQFTGRAGQTINLGLGGTQAWRAFELIAPDGSTVTTISADDGIRNLDLPSDGTYRFELHDRLDAGCCWMQSSNYELYLTTPTVWNARPDDHGEEAAEATLVRPGNSIGGSIETGGDVDWFRFDAVTGGAYTFAVTLDGLVDSVLSLYDTDGTTLLVKDDDGGDGLASRIEWTATTDGTYFVEVTAYNPSQTGRYRLSRTETEAAAPSARLPDLIVWDSEDEGYLCDWELDETTQPGRRLLRLTTAIPNVGDGPLELRGGEVGSDGTRPVYQRVLATDGGYTDHLAGEFVVHDGHGHTHFEAFAQYNLLEVTDDGGVGELVAGGEKTSFALIDGVSYDLTLPDAASAAVYRVDDNVQGISVGWADVYNSSLDDQWIDITGVPAGDYWLEVIVDPENRILETIETNNRARCIISLPSPIVTPQPPQHVTHLGPVDSKMLNGVLADSNSEEYFEFQPRNTGILTVRAIKPNLVPSGGLPDDGDGLPLRLFDLNGDPIDAVYSEGRLDVLVEVGRSYRLRVGHHAPGRMAAQVLVEFELEITNLVSLAGNGLWVHGTDGPDTIDVGLGTADPRNLAVNSTTYDVGLLGRLGVGPVSSVRVQAGAGDDLVRVDPLVVVPSRINGQAGDDALFGGGGDDILIGGAGRDRLVGDAGNDELRGLGGSDRLTGGPGDDVLAGGIGNDLLIEQGDVDFRLTDRTLTGVGSDSLSGIERTRLTGGESDNLLDAGGFSGPTTLVGGAGNDLLIGGDGRDRLNGKSGHDTLLGGDGNDRLYGGAGRDVLAGEQGNDRLNGQGGRDRLSGGGGNNRFARAEGEIDESIRPRELIPDHWAGLDQQDDLFEDFDSWADHV